MISHKILRFILFFHVCSMLLVSTGIAGMTIGEEREIGEKLLYKIRTEFSLIDDPDVSQYINRLGRQVLSQSGPHYFDYRFYVVPNDQFNAFAAPSGLIFFYTGLIETMKSEDELLSVLAHEVAHVESRHIASRTDKNAKVGAISMALAMASLALGDPSLAAGLFTGFQAAGLAASLHFSRIDEEQADRLSYKWMQSMRRDPRAMEGMLRTMRRIARYRSDQIPPYLLTHPNPEARLEYVQSLLDYQENKVDEGYYAQTDNFDFLRMKHRIMVTVADPQKARSYFSSILAAGSDSGERMMATYGLAMLEARELNFSKALEHLARVREYYPERPILDVDAGIMYLDSGETEQAARLFEAAVKADPDDMYGAFHLARAYAKTGKLQAGEQLYRKVMQALPEYPQVYFELGRIKSDQGQIGTSNFYLAKYYLYEGKLEFAREYLVKVKKDPVVTESVRDEADVLLERLDRLEK
ncbi:MAG: M48 family metalloprotease [Desulfobulbaceae bacterium]|nr:M48 family metalloprotease [Desulfobulbaceae bacterium]